MKYFDGERLHFRKLVTEPVLSWYHPPVCLGDHLWPTQGRATLALKVIFHVSTLHPSWLAVQCDRRWPSIQSVNPWTQQSYLNVNNVFEHNNIDMVSQVCTPRWLLCQLRKHTLVAWHDVTLDLVFLYDKLSLTYARTNIIEILHEIKYTNNKQLVIKKR